MDQSKINLSKSDESYRDDGIIRTYQGFLKDDRKLLKSSSGGIATALSEKIIKLGGVVYGVVYTDDFRSAYYSCAKTLEDLEPFKGSKYIKAHLQCNGISVYKSVKEKLDKGLLVLFIGLPCAVVGMRRYLGGKYDNLYLADLICYGPTLDIVQDKFINDLETSYNSKIENFTVRYKKEGWVPPYIKATFKDGNEYEESFYKSDFAMAFNFITHYSCGNCRAKGSNHASDVTLGDFWGLNKGDKSYNKNGVSIACIRTNKGESLLRNLEGVQLSLTDTDFAVQGNPYINNQRKIYKIKRKKFERLIESNDLKYACYKSLPARLKIKDYIKKAIPNFLILFLKDIIYIFINKKSKKN